MLNEYIKSTLNKMLPVCLLLFNFILDTGIIPDEWVTGSIKAIYKNSGDKKSPDNYRGITILSCF